MSFAEYELDKVKGDEPIPAGEYPVVITEMVEKPTKDGQGKRLAYKAQIISGRFQNRVIMDGFNVVNKSDEAQRIGRGQLKALLVALNLPLGATKEQVIGKKVIAVVKVKDDRNNIGNWKAFVQPSAQAAAKAPNLVEQAFGEGEPAAAKANPWA